MACNLANHWRSSSALAYELVCLLLLIVRFLYFVLYPSYFSIADCISLFLEFIRTPLHGLRNGWKNFRSKVLRKSWAEIRYWFSDSNVAVIWPIYVVCTGNPNMVMTLAGNKADLADKREVPVEVSSTVSVTYKFFFFDRQN